MIGIRNMLLTLAAIGATALPASAFPEYLDEYLIDAFRRPGIDGCNVCHQDPGGGGPRNAFGRAFESAGYTITQDLRDQFPDMFLAAEAAEGAASGDSEPAGLPENFGFFLTSQGPGNGGDLGGLAGADAHCQMLAGSVGAGNKTWRAYLSVTSPDEVINARDRIGSGPWYNAAGIMISNNLAQLHSPSNNVRKETALDERSEIVSGAGDDVNRHDILTGSRPDGTAWPWETLDLLNLSDEGNSMTCGNWTYSGEDGQAMVGHHDRDEWNAAHPSRGCSQENLRSTGGDGLFYCFAID
jgi:hypothetical protein